jgi:hypothetical protein
LPSFFILLQQVTLSKAVSSAFAGLVFSSTHLSYLLIPGDGEPNKLSYSDEK